MYSHDIHKEKNCLVNKSLEISKIALSILHGIHIYDCLGSTTTVKEKKMRRDELLNTTQTLWFLLTTVNSICIYTQTCDDARRVFFFWTQLSPEACYLLSIVMSILTTTCIILLYEVHPYYITILY
jgi:hypothetical protein